MASIDSSQLNDAQREAVLFDHEHGGPLLILAGAGSGKTAVLTRRIQYLMGEQQVAGENILALTFTVKAAGEMRERVLAGLDDLAENSVPLLCTFHSLAFRILSEFGIADTDGVPVRYPKIRVMTEPEHQIPSTEVTPSPTTLPAKVLHDKDNGVGVLLDDLIPEAMRLLECCDEVRLKLQGRWQYLLVDEYQDINPEQYKLVRLLQGESPRLFVVGDDDQAIYGFRGADVSNILRFQEDFPGCGLVRLEWNYRSASPVLDLANRIFPDKPKNLQKTLRPGRKSDDALFAAQWPVKGCLFANARDEKDWLARTVEWLRQEYEIPWKSMAILCRYQRQVDYYRQLLDYLGFSAEMVVQTLHASKGLQYPVVFYAGLSLGLSPAERNLESDEERRLFYVGVTRAESLLFLLHCKTRVWKGKKKRFVPSPYWKFLYSGPLKKSWWILRGKFY